MTKSQGKPHIKEALDIIKKKYEICIPKKGYTYFEHRVRKHERVRFEIGELVNDKKEISGIYLIVCNVDSANGSGWGFYGNGGARVFLENFYVEIRKKDYPKILETIEYFAKKVIEVDRVLGNEPTNI